MDYKLGYNPNPKYQPQTDVAEEIQRRMRILLEQTKKNIMQSYLKYKAYYDRKAKASPLETTDYCYILNPKADTQATKIPFREFRWQGPYKVGKVLPNNNYIVRRLGTNKTQLLHSPPDYTQITDDIEYVPVEVPEYNHPPSPKFPKNSGGSSGTDH